MMNMIILTLLPFVWFGSIYAPPPGGASYVSGSEGYCRFKAGDYMLNGPSMAELDRLPVPKLQTDVLNEVASYSSKVGRHAALGMHGTNLIKAVFGSALPEAFIKSAPILAPILGVVGAIMGFKTAGNDDSKERMLANTRTALEQLSSQVEQKFDNMQEYIEGNFIRDEKEDTLDELAEIFESFVNCAERKGDDAINQCNLEKSFTMDEKRANFKLFESEFKSGSNLAVLDAKKIEATLPITRDYVFKYLLTIQNYFVREQLLEADDLHYFNVFTKKIMKRIPVFARYARWGYEQIKRAHTTGNCDDMQCGSFVINHSERTQTKRCSCHMDKTDMSRLCTVLVTYKTYGVDKTRALSADNSGRNTLGKMRDYYVRAIRDELQSFWRKEILNPIDSWENTVTKITESRENYPDLEEGSAEGEDKKE